MIQLTDTQIADYFHRSYKTVDGLWFMKIEEKYGFDAALDIDDEVWKVVPKIQARKLKAMAGLPDGLDALFECFTTKLTLEGFTFAADKNPDANGFAVTITACPWFDLMARAKRTHLAGDIGTRICNTEYSVWAAEFGQDITFRLGRQICHGCDACVIRFQRESIRD